MITLDQAGWGRTALVILPPPPELDDLVEFLWIDARAHSASRSSQWRIVPDDAPHVIYARFIDRSGGEGHRLHVVGARRKYEDIDCSKRLLTAGARLKPGAVPALFRVSARELTDRSTTAESLVGSTARAALASLEDDPATHAASRIAAFVAALRRRGRGLDDRARWFSGTNRCIPNTIRDVATRAGVTERALHAWAMTHLGMGVKRLASIRRLHNALTTRLSDRSVTWSRIAALSGYADQPHLVRECRALLGESPGDFVARSG